jgi:uncharacterized membrane protein
LSSPALFVAVFLACAVEAVEATTIVLAAGTARHWRSAGAGAVTALGVLVGLVAALGPALSALPLRGLRLVVGALLLAFGLQWLRKAILRAAGRKAPHDEEEIFASEVEGAKRARTRRVAAVRDWYAFSLAFKGVLLEGLEVAFVTVTFGTTARDLPLAAVAALAAVAVVAAAGAAARAPLARVPENTLKFVVGVMLSAFGTFWGAEGAGASWPGGDAALLALVPLIALFGGCLVLVLRPGAPSGSSGVSVAPVRVFR